VSVGSGHMGLGSCDFRFQRLDSFLELVLAQRIEILPAENGERVVCFGWEEVVIHEEQR